MSHWIPCEIWFIVLATAAIILHDHWLNACVIKFRFPIKYGSMVPEIQQVDFEQDMGPNQAKISPLHWNSMEKGVHLLQARFGAVSTLKAAYRNKLIFWHAFNQWSMQYPCCYSHYCKSHLTWNAMARWEGVYLLSRAAVTKYI